MEYMKTEAKVTARSVSNVLIVSVAAVGFVVLVRAAQVSSIVEQFAANASFGAATSTRSEILQSGILQRIAVATGNAAKNAALVADLRAIRQRAIAQGMKLLTIDEINAEVRRRRGEV